jgi:hypothetical protein
LPVAGRPRVFLGLSFIDFFMNLGLSQKQAEGKASLFRSGSNPNHEGCVPMIQVILPWEVRHLSQKPTD